MSFKSFDVQPERAGRVVGDFGTLFPLAIGYIVVNGSIRRVSSDDGVGQLATGWSTGCQCPSSR
jgi:hypothetical protein